MLSNILLYTVRRLRIALAQSIQGEYVSLIQKNLVTELENMLNVQQWVYVSRMSHLLCEKKNSLVHNHQARILQVVAYLLPRWEGRTEFIKKKQRSSRPFQATSVNEHVSLWSPFLLLLPFLWQFPSHGAVKLFHALYSPSCSALSRRHLLCLSIKARACSYDRNGVLQMIPWVVFKGCILT